MITSVKIILITDSNYDLSNLKVYYVTHAATVYTIVATSYEEALTVAGFAAEDTTKNSESSY